MKPFKSTNQLVELLRDERGLEIDDHDTAVSYLRRTNYYRFTGYSRYFQLDPACGNNKYRDGTSFEQITELIRRDDELRMQLFVPISEVEMSVRARFAHLAGRKFGDESFYLRAENYISDTPETSKRIRDIAIELRETSSGMVRHYRDDEDLSRIPIWVAVEVLSFGKLSWMVESLKVDGLREELADFFGYSRAPFPRVLHSLSALRNSCAHHSQLWHRNLTIQCPLPLSKRERPRDIVFHEHGLYPAILALKKLVKSEVSRAQLAAIDKSLRDESTYAAGLLTPEGVR
ncbi:Abi family protein [Flaviflexus massiliensis]|uniref:Abi family protein n=1 Tax=Flaviflexus massiliensis TaxID=1522309 RepID=UPI0006D57DBC|nr:Abi family protein [Flaviflexus massiliensis]